MRRCGTPLQSGHYSFNRETKVTTHRKTLTRIRHGFLKSYVPCWLGGSLGYKHFSTGWIKLNIGSTDHHPTSSSTFAEPSYSTVSNNRTLACQFSLTTCSTFQSRCLAVRLCRFIQCTTFFKLLSFQFGSNHQLTERSPVLQFLTWFWGYWEWLLIITPKLLIYRMGGN